MYESIGERGILSARLGEQLLNIVTKPEQKFDKNKDVWISFPYKDLYFFEHGTGNRLRNLELHKPSRTNLAHSGETGLSAGH